MVRIANCSGFYGDRLSAAREQVEGGPIDVLTGDWLAELTMLILAGNRTKGRPGYATTFVTQLSDVLATCLDRGIKVVSNAGGLDPEACAQAIRDLGLPAKVATVTGDDLMPRLPELGPLVNLDTGETLTEKPVTANAYLGGFPIAAALSAGADVVVTGRVTDAALVTGPGIWRYGWGPADLDALAGSVVAGHVIECGCQATGGNYAFFDEIPDLAHCGFPIAELHDDGSSVITKHPGTGGAVTVGTVTAQLLYEIAGPRYPGPDVTARFDTIRLMQEGPDRVSVSGVRGEAPPPTLKAAVNLLGGYRNTMTLVVTGLDADRKAQVAEEAVWARVPRETFEQTYTERNGDLLRITVMDPDRRKAGRLFSSAVVETGLASYPGFYGLTPPGDASPYGVYWPVAVPRVTASVTLDGAEVPFEEAVPEAGEAAPVVPEGSETPGPWFSPPMPIPLNGEEELRPLGLIAGARSGDKGGNANLGVWVRSADHYAWLRSYLTAERLPELLPEVTGLRIDRHTFPNLLAVNFVVHGLLGRGVAASPLMDAQAKALGERLRAVLVPLP
ncbi:acyclic terpene utilization AtuA family protein [Herbidospora sp. NEAU-GS84]|uniref:Acyclic terpene utilization AtuA family protein n=1 Tax=Herbidospora solisilvae TaxID=2696284 RepID=A0A7C9NM19_9ACTN|nr:acyclic terpene utilization AtuA family protein [Herbidospora solisilvae]NAS21836.1 acyclic terpene utilization AtuA family protein [Herbidospora solisilvae]